MKSKVRVAGKLYNPTVFKTATGADLYSFSMQVSNQDKKTQEWHNVFMPVTIFDKDNRHVWILEADKKEATVEGSLTVKNGFTKKDGTVVANHVEVFGFEGNLGEKLMKTALQNATQAPAATQQNYTDPVAEVTEPNSTLPF